MATETPIRQETALPAAVTLAADWREDITRLRDHLISQADWTMRAANVRHHLVEMESEATLAPEIDGKNEQTRAAQRLAHLDGRYDYRQARDDLINCEHEIASCGAAIEVARERCRYARTLLALLTAQASADMEPAS